MTTLRRSETLRLFIVVDLSPEQLSPVSHLVRGLRESDVHGIRLVAVENIHLTLKFLGDTNRKQIPSLIAALDVLGTQITPFTVTLGNVGGFPNLKHPRVLWVGLAGMTQSVTTLAHDVEDVCQSIGFQRGSQSSSPHLTMARMRATASAEDRKKAGETLLSLPWEPGISVSVYSFKLIESTLTPSGPIYRSLHTVPLSLPLTTP